MFVPWLFALFAQHSCQQDHSAKPLSPVVLLPAPSGISYESLHYPVPAEQLYQVIPLVINTGRIPLISHAVHAPIQYFMPNGGDNQRTSADQHPAAAQPTAPRNSRPAYPSTANERRSPTAMYSETHAEGQPTSRYGIVDGSVGERDDDQSETVARDDGEQAGLDSGVPRPTVIVREDPKMVEAELKKHYKKTTRSETRRDGRTDRNGNVTRH